MSRVRGYKQHALKVVPHRPLRVIGLTIISGMFFLLTVAGAYYYGHKNGLKIAGSAVTELNSIQTENTVLHEDITRLRQELMLTSQEVVLDQKTLSEVQQAVTNLRQQNSELEQEVIFFRSIMAPEDNAEGIVLGQLRIMQAARGAYHYNWRIFRRGDNSQVVRGRAVFTLHGRLDGEDHVIPFSKISQQHFGSDIALQFRYFQTIEGDANLPDNFVPSNLHVDVSISNPVKEKFEQDYPWVLP
jgi:hypothetical protein